MAADVRVWLADGGSVTFYFKSPGGAGTVTRYARKDVCGSVRGAAIHAAETITGNYDTQWLVSFAQSGIGTDTTATVVSVNSSDKTAANLAAGVSVWVTDGGAVTYDFKSPVATTNSNKQYRLTGVTGPGN